MLMSFKKACWESKPPWESQNFQKSIWCVCVPLLFNWSWDINPHHPVCDSGRPVETRKETPYLGKQRKLLMFSSTECHSAVDHFPLTTHNSASGRSVSGKFPQTPEHCARRGKCWVPSCVYRWNKIRHVLNLSEAWQRNLTHLYGSLYRL